ncbi:MAG: hypothetical protein FLDDKLPJ_01110 [Phycisphaerae bacterium]|nr:hypothetical protein [Phycisphaerae bacterium]
MSANLTWLGHSAVRLTLPDGRVVLIDPWLSGNPSCPVREKQQARCDLLILTHGHADHVGDAEALIRKFDPPVVANYDLCCALQRAIGVGRYQGMNTGGTQRVAGVTVRMTRAYHSSALDAPQGPMYAGMPNGVIVEAPGAASVYHAGDTDVFSDMALIARMWSPKVACLPIGDLFTMGAQGAALAAEMLQPAAILPIHYRTFPVLAGSAEEFRRALPMTLRDRVVTPEPGTAVAWTADGLG